MWFPIGYAVMGPSSREVRAGRFAGTLPGGVLYLMAEYLGQGSPDPLSFLLFDFLDDDGIRPLQAGKWWPKEQPSVVQLGPGIASEVAGTILIRPRSYNLRWLEAGLPEPLLPVAVSAWLETGTASPFAVPRGFDAGNGVVDVIGEPVGPGAAYAVGNQGG